MTTWTKTPPRADGLYWLKVDDRKPTVVNVYDSAEKDEDFGPMVAMIGTDWDKSISELSMDHALEWFGPIEPPVHP